MIVNEMIAVTLATAEMGGKGGLVRNRVTRNR